MRLKPQKKEEKDTNPNKLNKSHPDYKENDDDNDN